MERRSRPNNNRSFKLHPRLCRGCSLPQGVSMLQTHRCSKGALRRGGTHGEGEETQSTGEKQVVVKIPAVLHSHVGGLQNKLSVRGHQLAKTEYASAVYASAVRDTGDLRASKGNAGQSVSAGPRIRVLSGAMRCSAVSIFSASLSIPIQRNFKMRMTSSWGARSRALVSANFWMTAASC
jgi:hypothetical protein